MAEIVEFAPTAAEAPALGTIRLGSQALALLFTVLLVGWAAVAVAVAPIVLAYPGDRLQLCAQNGFISLAREVAHPPGCTSFAALPFSQRLAHALVGVALTAPGLVILWHLRALFRLYAQGVIFARDNAVHLKGVGAALAVAAFAPLAGHAVLAGLGMAIDRNWMHLASVQQLILGALVYVIAQVMQVGHQLEEEQRHIV